MTVSRSIIAAFTLFAWLFAVGHVSLEHDDVEPRHFAGAFLGMEGEHHHHGPGEHHHDLDLESLPLIVKLGGQGLPEPLWNMEDGVWMEVLHALKSERPIPVEECEHGTDPPDLRGVGWLFVSHTARQVRGPSIAA